MKLTKEQEKELFEYGQDIEGEEVNRRREYGAVDGDRLLEYMEEDMDNPVVTEQLPELERQAIRDEAEKIVEAGIEYQKFLFAIEDIKPDLKKLLDYCEADEKNHYEAEPNKGHIYLVIKRLRDKLNG
jgi:hypothetical protein